MKYVTISREYGANGNSIGRAAAKELGVEFYDRDIIRAMVKLTDSDYDTIREDTDGLSAFQSFVSNITPISYDQKEHLYDMQREIILNLAKEQGPCFFLGRCADVILPEEGFDVLKVFIQADEVHRAVRVADYINSTNADEIIHAMHKKDRERRNYYEHYSHERWGDIKNYDLVLDSGTLGFDTCVKIICEAAKA